VATATHAVVFKTEAGEDFRKIFNGGSDAAKPKGRLENVDDVFHYKSVYIS
jgi:hypothetical protein